MKKIFEKYCSYLEPKSIYWIKHFWIISSVTCLLSVLLLCFYNTYFISPILYEASLVIFRTGIMIGIFPICFAIIIGKWKSEH